MKKNAMLFKQYASTVRKRRLEESLSKFEAALRISRGEKRSSSRSLVEAIYGNRGDRPLFPSRRLQTSELLSLWITDICGFSDNEIFRESNSTILEKSKYEGFGDSLVVLADAPERFGIIKKLLDEIDVPGCIFTRDNGYEIEQRPYKIVKFSDQDAADLSKGNKVNTDSVEDYKRDVKAWQIKIKKIQKDPANKDLSSQELSRLYPKAPKVPDIRVYRYGLYIDLDSDEWDPLKLPKGAKLPGADSEIKTAKDLGLSWVLTAASARAEVDITPKTTGSDLKMSIFPELEKQKEVAATLSENYMEDDEDSLARSFANSFDCEDCEDYENCEDYGCDNYDDYDNYDSYDEDDDF